MFYVIIVPYMSTERLEMRFSPRTRIVMPQKLRDAALVDFDMTNRYTPVHSIRNAERWFLRNIAMLEDPATENDRANIHGYNGSSSGRTFSSDVHWGDPRKYIVNIASNEGVGTIFLPNWSLAHDDNIRTVVLFERIEARVVPRADTGYEQDIVGWHQADNGEIVRLDPHVVHAAAPLYLAQNDRKITFTSYIDN